MQYRQNDLGTGLSRVERAREWMEKISPLNAVLRKVPNKAEPDFHDWPRMKI